MLDLSTLNAPQRQAVQTIDGPLLVLAGAGSGKTRVIVHRIAWMLEKGISPEAILAVTFTNKAAAEMRERVARLVGDRAARPLTVSTFHAFGCEVLRRYIDRLGYPRRFAIADTGDQMAIIRRLLKESAVPVSSLDNTKLLARISRAKSSGEGIEIPTGETRHEARPALEVRLRFSQPLRARSYEKIGIGTRDITRLLTRSVDAETVLAERLLPRYQRSLRAQGMVDFDDLILLTAELIRNEADIRQKLTGRFRYLLVDEYQDTNKSQLALLKLLSGERQNVCAVGDDDQSIYSWRGADPESVLAFDRHFVGVREIRLEQNYRSKGRILEAANAVIARNEARKDKRLWTESAAGEKIRLAALSDEHAEAAFIAREIQKRLIEGVSPKDIAVLYRTNLQSRPLEEALREAEIPYEIVGGQSFFDRKEIKDLLAYLKLMANPSDDVSLLRIINTPARGIGEATVEALSAFARENRLTLTLALEQVSDIAALSESAKGRLSDFRELIGRYRTALTADGSNLGEVTKALVSEIALRQAARASVQSVRAGENKVKAIDAFLESVQSYADRTGGNPPTLHGLVSKFALDGIDADTGLSGSAVHLMTLHASKGLEWPHVIMCGMEEGLLPHAGMEGEAPNLPEERRLCYVGITRARDSLCLTRAARRTHQGKATQRTPSRYLADIPPDLLEEVDASAAMESAAEMRRKTDSDAAQFFGSLADKLRKHGR